MQSVGNNYVLVYGITDHLLAKPLQKEVNAFKLAITKPMNTWVEHVRPSASTINVDVERVNISAVKILIKRPNVVMIWWENSVLGYNSISAYFYK